MATALLDRSLSTRDTSSTETVTNNSGGDVYAVSKLTQLRRFLILGTEGGTFYASQKALTLENAGVVRWYCENDPIGLLAEIRNISDGGLAVKNDQALFALAMCAGLADEEGRRCALFILPKIARTATHLFQFVSYAEQFRGWGRALKRAVADWYRQKDADKLAYQLIKYRQRAGWTHRDLLRKAHPKIDDLDVKHRSTLAFGAGKWTPTLDGSTLAPDIIYGYNLAQAPVSQNSRDRSHLVAEYGLPWEAFPTEAHKDPLLWRAIVSRGMPYTALMRNLSRFARLDLFADPLFTLKVCNDLKDPAKVKGSRVHPLTILNALKAFKLGRSLQPGSTSTWTPDSRVCDALDAAFYHAFNNVEPSGKRTLIALDVSASMTWHMCAGTALTPREASAAVALAMLASDPGTMVVGFTREQSLGSGRNGLAQLDLSPRRRLDDNIREIEGLPMGGTDCSLPIRAAEEMGLAVDTFVVMTDSETNRSTENPSTSLRRYRRKSGINAKLVVAAFESNGFSIADPADAGMLDIAGLSTDTPRVIADFSAGRI